MESKMHPRLSNQRVVNSMFSVLGMLFSAAYACGQTEPQLIPRSAEEQKAQFEAHRRIRLAAIITDQSGAVVTGLKEKEFAVFENGTSRPILRFTEVTKGDAAKAHGLIVVDGLNDGLSALHRQEKEIKEFLNHTRTLPFPVAIDVVSEGGVSEGLASTDPAMLVRDLDERTSHVEGNDCGTTHPGSDLGSRMSGGWQPLPQSTSGWAQADCRIGHFNASMIALNQIFAREAKAQGRAIVIWLGPGWPLPPEQDRGQAMPTSNGGGARDMVTVLSTDIQVGQVEFDAVSWGEFARQKGVGRTNAVADISTSSQTEQEKMLSIPALAEQSGGLSFARAKNIPDVLDRLLSQDATFYQLEYDPAAANKPNDFRTVLVQVVTPGATVRTMHSYFAQP
jgi:VWFA-related protein